MYKRLIALSLVFMVMFASLYMHIYVVMTDKGYTQTANNSNTYTITAGTVNGNIYDRNFNLLNNNSYEYIAAVNPTSEAIAEILPYAKDKQDFYSNLKYGRPFTCAVEKKDFSSSDITVFEVPMRTSDSQIARHVIGYSQNGKGMSGLEYAYNDFLRSVQNKNQVTYYVNGMGQVLNGIDKKISYADSMKTGIVTTIDYNIQKICENATQNIDKGAVIVMDINSGEILAMVSKPSFSVNNLQDALSDENSPLINRTLYAYNVGSIFKLVTAAEALNEGLSIDYSYNCTGFSEISGQRFNCHKLSGHGVQNMEQAMTNSCNTYFIDLVQKIDTNRLWTTSSIFGFGRENILCDNIVSSAGNLPSKAELSVSAEKANFSFGQGKLLATPIQIASLTCAIANGGRLYNPKLVKGKTYDGTNIENPLEPSYAEVLSPDVAYRLQSFMTAAVNNNEESNAKPENVTAAGKTSTAQTGRFDDAGIEICQAWITGFFPVYEPQYAITVLVEDGGYGNSVAAPIFKEIADKIYQ